LKLRKQVELFATYFRREFDYAIREFDARDKDPYTAYLFPDPNARIWIGACCFRPESYAYDVYSDTLRWIWLHPYYRMKGVLTEAWPFFRANHGETNSASGYLQESATYQHLMKQTWKSIL